MASAQSEATKAAVTGGLLKSLAEQAIASRGAGAREERPGAAH